MTFHVSVLISSRKGSYRRYVLFQFTAMYKILTCLIARSLGSNFVAEQRMGLKEKRSLTKL